VLKAEPKQAALKRQEEYIRMAKWNEGKQGENVR
jgi:hypothetical protein